MIKIIILCLCILFITGVTGLAADIITVQSVIISSSEILAAQEIREITSHLEGATVTLAEIQQVVDKLNSLYAAQNYITAKAILLPQELANGVVQIQLVEGRVGAVSVENNRFTKDSYFTKRMSLKPGDLVEIGLLEHDIAYFNRTNDVQMAAELKAGKEFGQTDCVLKVSEPPRNPVAIYTDNGGRKETGLYRLGMSVTDNSLFGVRDNLAFSGIFATGAVGVSASYDLPIRRSGSRVSVSYDYSETNIIAGNFESVDIVGYSKNLGVKLTSPTKVEPELIQYASLEWRSNKADNFFSGVKLINSEYEKVTASISAQSATGNQVVYLQQDLTTGWVKEPKEKDFVKYTGSLTVQRLVGDNLVLTCRGAFQLTPDDLLPSPEQFSLGGMATVRGYAEGALAGDQGYLVSVELSEQVSERLTTMVFLDHGGAFPFKGNDEPVKSTDYALSVGLGVVAKFTDQVSGKVVVGFPVRQEQPPQLHLLIQASL